MANAMCDNKFSQADFTSNQSLYRSVIDPTIVQAALECYRLNSRGLHYSIHSDADTHAVSISLYYDGPSPVDVTDVGIVGNAKCDGELFSAWSSAPEKRVSLDPKTRALTCTPKADDTTAIADIPAGSITIATTAGPIDAQIPRRFSPTLESRFENVESNLVIINAALKQAQARLSKHVLGAATIRTGKVESISNGASLDPASGRFTFPNPDNLKFIPIVTSVGWQGLPYQTEDCFSRNFNAQDQGPNYATLWQGALDTGGRNHPPTNCSITIIAID
jgi:hypothetical protein